MSRGRQWRNVPRVRDPAKPIREALKVHSYISGTGESIEIWLNEFCTFVVYSNGKVIHSEARARHQGPHTPWTAKARALAYEKQTRDEYERSIGNPPPDAA